LGFGTVKQPPPQEEEPAHSDVCAPQVLEPVSVKHWWLHATAQLQSVQFKMAELGDAVQRASRTTAAAMNELCRIMDSSCR